MFLGKELLLSCIVMMHISLMASRAAVLGRHEDLEPCSPKLEVRKEMMLPLCDLLQAEMTYVEHICNGKPKLALQPIEKITLPVRNVTEEIQASVCAISEYISCHLPAIIKSLALEHHDDIIIKKATVFRDHFRNAFGLKGIRQHTKCPRINITTSDDYSKKVKGLQIIYFSRKWVESFMHINATC